MSTTVRFLGRTAAMVAIAGLITSTASAGYITTLGIENTFYEPAGWSVGDVNSTYQEWNDKDATTGNLADQGYTTNPSSLTDATHSAKAPGFITGTSNFYSFSTHYGATADIYNHGGSSGGGGYGPTFGTHVIVQVGTSQNQDEATWATYGDGSHTEFAAGHGVGVFWDTLQLVDLSDAPITGGGNDDALVIAEVSYREGVTSSFGEVDYQELIYEFWLPGYTGDFRVDWDQVVHGTIDTLRVDSMIAEAAPGGITPFVATVPEPSSAVLMFGMTVLGGLGYIARRRRR